MFDNSQRDEAPNADVKSGFASLIWHYFNKEQLQILPEIGFKRSSYSRNDKELKVSMFFRKLSFFEEKRGLFRRGLPGSRVVSVGR